MNEHLWKKLGEVKAFALATNEFLTRGKEGFIAGEIFSAEDIDQLASRALHHSEKIDEFSETDDAADTVNKKAEATGQKLVDMQDRYLADEDDWQDPMELLEWSGFFFGGAVVHWNLIRGISESVHNPDLTALGEGGFNFYFQIMETVSTSIHRLAKAEAAD
ncbi:MAG: hypothetical protein WD552_02540 [Candidatus Paceibacterota bacterium]